MTRSLVLVPILVLATAACAPQPSDTPESAPPADEPAILVFSKTAGYRHASIEPGIEAIRALGAEHGFTVEATEDSTQFTDENLARFDAVLFLSTTQDVLDDEEQAAMERFIRGGGGYVGIHAASDTEYEWPWYGQMVGGWFESHPAIQEAKLFVADSVHASTAHLPSEWVRTDEWYEIDRVNLDVDVLLEIDETSYHRDRPPSPGNRRPMAWYHEFEGGRVFYTALGHTIESYSEPEFLQHVLGGIDWVLKRR